MRCTLLSNANIIVSPLIAYLECAHGIEHQPLYDLVEVVTDI